MQQLWLNDCAEAVHLNSTDSVSLPQGYSSKIYMGVADGNAIFNLPLADVRRKKYFL